VTYEQFTRALTKLGLDMPDICFKVLSRKYMDKNNTRDVNYSAFLKEVDNVHLVDGENHQIPMQMIQKQIVLENGGAVGSPDNRYGLQTSELVDGHNNVFDSQVEQENDNLGFITSAKETTRPEFGGSYMNTIHNVDDLEKKLKAEIVMNKLRIHEYFGDFDKLRKGFITKDQFRRVLELTGIQLSDEQFNMLMDRYTLPSGMVDHATFSAKIKSIHTTKGIQKDPLYNVYQITSDTTLPARRYNMKTSSEEENNLTDLLQLIRKEIITRRLLFKPHF
jgi:Ca2+-binding EF-hand superfamily protein